MRLADYIEAQMPLVIARWDDFAATQHPAASTMSQTSLRDHAEELLRAIVADLRSEQSQQQQHAKSLGQRDAVAGATPATAAQVHALLRAGDGFSIQQLVAEYRALRASVLFAYTQDHGGVPLALQDIGRFNEAVDQAIAESVEAFSGKVEHWRNLFLSVLQHDLRGPLHAVLATVQLLAALPPGAAYDEAIARLRRSADRMHTLLDELLDYNRATLNLGFAIHVAPCDLAAACHEEVELRRAAHPAHAIEWACSGPTMGQWDASRIKQALGNLISNAAKHGAPHEPIHVELRGEAGQVQITVSNHGPDIPAESFSLIFNPLQRLAGEAPGSNTHLGLGLFIVRAICEAHGGEVTVESSQGITRFRMRIPRVSAADPA